ncbi:hypothetical protein MTR67_003020, partial [Solanum verrucosum]
QLTKALFLNLTNSSDGYVIYCDAFRVSLGCLLMQRDYDMSMNYHPGKANVVVDALSRLSMGSVAHVEKERMELAKDVHRLALLGVRLMSISNGGVTLQNGSKSSLVV